MPIAQDKRGYPDSICFISALNICCEYSLEAPRRSVSNEYHNICFCREIRKKNDDFRQFYFFYLEL